MQGSVNVDWRRKDCKKEKPNQNPVQRVMREDSWSKKIHTYGLVKGKVVHVLGTLSLSS